MRHVVALPVVAALTLGGGLSGCAQLGLPAITPTDTAAFVQEVQSLTVAACGFVPSAATIAGLVTAGNGAATAGLQLGSAIAGIVCGAVKATAPQTSLRALGRGDRLVGRARGVPIVGHFR